MKRLARLSSPVALAIGLLSAAACLALAVARADQRARPRPDC